MSRFRSSGKESARKSDTWNGDEGGDAGRRTTQASRRGQTNLATRQYTPQCPERIHRGAIGPRVSIAIVIGAAVILVGVTIRGPTAIAIPAVGSASVGRLIVVWTAIAIPIIARAIPVVPQATIHRSVLAFEFFMEAAMLPTGMGILMKVLVHPTQVLMNGVMLPRIMVGKGGRTHQEHPRQRQSCQKGRFQRGLHTNSFCTCLSVDQHPAKEKVAKKQRRERSKLIIAAVKTQRRAPSTRPIAECPGIHHTIAEIEIDMAAIRAVLERTYLCLDAFHVQYAGSEPPMAVLRELWERTQSTPQLSGMRLSIGVSVFFLKNHTLRAIPKIRT
jgi:hypothetical protein